MNILLTAATSLEIALSTVFMEGHWEPDGDRVFRKGEHRITLLITGVGMVATSYALTKMLQTSRFDLALQAGIGGSYDRDLPLGMVVLVQTDQFGDLGAEDHYKFLDVFELGLEQADEGVFRNKGLNSTALNLLYTLGLKKVSGLTVNTVSGSAFTTEARIKKYGAQLESMEGAAFHYVCLNEQVPFLQVRAISNYVEPRNRDSWKIGEAVRNLNDWLIGFISALPE